MKVYFETYGCAKNRADTEIMKNLVRKKHELSDLESSDVLVINTCAVKLTTENKILYRIKELSKKDKKIVVAGCMAETLEDKLKKINQNLSFINPQAVHRINDLLELLKTQKSAKIFEKRPENKLKYHESPKSVIDIIPISEGCLNSCSYCITKLARKNLVSFPREFVIKAIRNSVKNNVKEFWLSSEDTGCYGFDLKYTLADLLKEVSQIKGNFRVRVGMMNPNHVIKILEPLMESYDSEKIYKFLHIPVQSGSDNVLKDMIRNYTVKDFKAILHKFRKKYPKITIATDIIAGFPTETEKDFKKTIKLLKKTKPDIVNLSRYSPRPGTLAKKLYHEIDSKIVKERTRKLSKLIKEISYKQNKKWGNWAGEVLVSEKGKGETMQARNYAYKPVVLEKGKLGSFLCAKITEVHTTYLRGKEIRPLD